MEHERRESDTRLALIEQKLDLTLQNMADRFDSIEGKLDKYNGTRERIDGVCKELIEHKTNHWQALTVTVAVMSIIVGVVLKVVFR